MEIVSAVRSSGLSAKLIDRISSDKTEPKWMREHRLDSLKKFNAMDLPRFGPDLSKLDLNEIIYYAPTGVQTASDWGEVPDDIRRVYERLGIPEAEMKWLAGAGAQYESDIIYHNLHEEWEKSGVIFMNMDEAVKNHSDLIKEYFMKCVSSSDHKFAALHGAVWSGGTFLYVPKGLIVTEPLQAYFWMNAPNMGQFEHTLIIADEGSEVHYIEGCSAPKYGKQGLHAGCVEIYAKAGSRVRYSSVENWSKDTFNLNTKRAIVEKDAVIEWVGGNLGAGVTMLYPCSVLAGEGAKCDHLGIAFAGENQWQDTGAKVIHKAKHTSSRVVSKSVSKDGGTCVYRGTVRICPEASGSIASVECSSLLLDRKSRADAVPEIKIENSSSAVSHEAKVGKLSEEELFYLASRGIGEDEAKAMIVNGFMEPIVKLLPLEYAVEMNRLIEMEMETESR